MRSANPGNKHSFKKSGKKTEIDVWGICPEALRFFDYTPKTPSVRGGKGRGAHTPGSPVFPIDHVFKFEDPKL